VFHWLPLTLLLAISVGVCQSQAPGAPAQSQPPGQDSNQQKDSDKSAPQETAPPEEEHRISPDEAKELFQSVDEIMAFASKDTGLPIRRSVKRRLTSRDEVAAFIQKHLDEDKDAQRLRRSELVLKKFGLIPRDFDLGKFLVALLREQVAGYYDSKTRTVNLLNWIDAEQQKPVMAHELTHALQDQRIGLEKWMEAGDVDLDKVREPTPADIERDEISEARQAVVEGQAMVVLVDYMLAPIGKSLLESPDMVEALKAGLLVGTADSVEFHNAPIFLKESLTFPYRYGLDFIAALLTKGGKDKAFAAVLDNPPTSTRQIMEPQTYISGERLEPMRLPDFDRDFKNYSRFDIGAIGEFDVAVLVDQYAGVGASKDLYPHWRGGYYYAAMPKGTPASPLGLLFVSRWSDATAAQQFAAIYEASLGQRYKHAHQTGGEKTAAGLVAGAKPESQGDQAKADSDDKATDSEKLATLTGKHIWLTEDGTVQIEVLGDTVMVTESLGQDTTDQLEKELFPPLKPTK
jgi:hypothetical protein